MTSRPLTDTEIDRILAEMPLLRDKCLFVLGLRTGFRISELLSLSLNDVWDGVKCRGVLTVHRKSMKGKQRSRSVPLHAQAQRMLEEYICMYKPDNFLFPITRQHAWRVIKQAAVLAGLDGCIATHSMRKSFAARVYAKSGKDLIKTQSALGHASVASTQAYLAVNKDEVDELILAI